MTTIAQSTDDAEVEPEESMRLALTSPSAGAAVGPASGKIVTIVDDDLPAAIFADGFESGDTSAWDVVVP